MGFKRLLRTIKSVIGKYPGVLRGIKTAHCVSNRNPHVVLQLYPQLLSPSKEGPLTNLQVSVRSVTCLLPANLRVAAFVGNKSDLLSIRRPTRVRLIPISIRNRKCVASIRWHQPKVLPLPTQIRAVHHPRTIRRKVRPSFPARLLVVNFSRFRAQLRLHAPEPTSSMDVPAVRNEQNLFSITRPNRINLHVVRAVVVPGQRTLRLTR